MGVPGCQPCAVDGSRPGFITIKLRNQSHIGLMDNLTLRTSNSVESVVASLAIAVGELIKTLEG